ncbi:MAG TPA: glycoside hydrolase family 38 C-terminal domain-containing protein, partial [Anaerolineae bacterium]
QLQSPKATYDTAYGFIERKCNGEEEPGQQWVDVTGETSTTTGETITYGVSLLNDSKYGFDVLDSDLRMSVLRSPIYAYHDPYKPEPNREYVYQDQGEQTVIYRLIPHAGQWQNAEVSRRAWELNIRPFWVNEYAHAGDLPVNAAFVMIEPANIVLSVCKVAEDSDTLIVRGYESTGVTTHAVLSLPTLAIRHEVVFQAHEIKTIAIDAKNHAITEVDLLERPI